MATFAQIRAGLATQLRTISGLRVYEQYPAEEPILPAAIIDLPTMDYHRVLGDVGGSMQVQVLILVSAERAGYARAHQALDLMLDPTSASSVHAAVEPNNTLSGLIRGLEVTGFSDYGPHDFGTVTYLGARVAIDIWT